MPRLRSLSSSARLGRYSFRVASHAPDDEHRVARNTIGRTLEVLRRTSADISSAPDELAAEVDEMPLRVVAGTKSSHSKPLSSTHACPKVRSERRPVVCLGTAAVPGAARREPLKPRLACPHAHDHGDAASGVISNEPVHELLSRSCATGGRGRGGRKMARARGRIDCCAAGCDSGEHHSEKPNHCNRLTYLEPPARGSLSFIPFRLAEGDDAEGDTGTKGRAFAGLFDGGASRTRTGDLLGAISARCLPPLDLPLRERQGASRSTRRGKRRSQDRCLGGQGCSRQLFLLLPQAGVGALEAGAVSTSRLRAFRPARAGAVRTASVSVISSAASPSALPISRFATAGSAFS
jgi:hypothetical protein